MEYLFYESCPEMGWSDCERGQPNYCPCQITIPYFLALVDCLNLSSFYLRIMAFLTRASRSLLRPSVASLTSRTARRGYAEAVDSTKIKLSLVLPHDVCTITEKQKIASNEWHATHTSTTVSSCSFSIHVACFFSNIVYIQFDRSRPD